MQESQEKEKMPAAKEAELSEVSLRAKLSADLLWMRHPLCPREKDALRCERARDTRMTHPL